MYYGFIIPAFAVLLIPILPICQFKTWRKRINEAYAFDNCVSVAIFAEDERNAIETGYGPYLRVPKVQVIHSGTTDRL